LLNRPSAKAGAQVQILPSPYRKIVGGIMEEAKFIPGKQYQVVRSQGPSLKNGEVWTYVGAGGFEKEGRVMPWAFQIFEPVELASTSESCALCGSGKSTTTEHYCENKKVDCYLCLDCQAKQCHPDTMCDRCEQICLYEDPATIQVSKCEWCGSTDKLSPSHFQCTHTRKDRDKNDLCSKIFCLCQQCLEKVQNSSITFYCSEHREQGNTKIEEKPQIEPSGVPIKAEQLTQAAIVRGTLPKMVYGEFRPVGKLFSERKRDRDTETERRMYEREQK
jgi:hypothetical protein